MEYHQLCGYMFINLIGILASAQVITVRMCAYRGGTCNMDAVRCHKGYTINIKSLFLEATWYYTSCFTSCSYCCGNAKTLNIGKDFKTLKSLCNNYQHCTVTPMRGSRWVAKIEYICSRIRTVAETTFTSKTTTMKTVNGDITHSTTVSSDILNTKPEVTALFPVAAAVSIPISSIAAVVIAITVFCVQRKRRRDQAQSKEVCNVSHRNDHNIMAKSNQACTEICPEDDINYSNIPTERQVPALHDLDCINVQANAEGKDTDEYNTIDFSPGSFSIDAGYDHLPRQEQATDNTYSHIMGEQSHAQHDTTYSHIASNTGETKEPPFPSDEPDQTYNNLQTVDRRGMISKRVLHTEEDDEYNHTNVVRTATQN